MIKDGCEIWIASISDYLDHSDALDSVLTPEERAHVERVRHGRATARLSRGLLRLVLAHYLQLTPTEIGIDRSCPDCSRAHGRPRLHAGTDAIEFSVTHGGDLLVLAFTGQGPIGVDVEPIDAFSDVGTELVDFTLTPAERADLQAMPAAERKRVFLRYWTAKEAVLKAIGTGLDVEPQAIELPPPSVTAAVSVMLPGSLPVELWVSSVDVGPAHVCTLVTGREVHRVRVTRLSPDLAWSLGADA